MSNTTDTTDPAAKSMDDIMALCKRRGFIFPASEIYGGLNGFWDYGPLGAQLKKNLKDAWWRDNVLTPPTGPDGAPVSIVGLDSSIIQNPKVWEASGHVGGFNDPMVDDKETKQRFRADQLVGIWIGDTEESIKMSRKESFVSPACTIVASTPGEGATLFAANKKALKHIGIKLTSNFKPSIIFGDACMIASAVDQHGNIGQVELEMIDVCDIKNNPLKIPSPFSGKQDVLTTPRDFNLMFPTVVGATGDIETNKAYLRPETAQGIFINFKNVMDSTRVEPPFGIAQMGKAFRNEVTPRNYTFRSREFEQMEIEFFCAKEQAPEWYAFWRDNRLAWWKSLGLTDANLQLRVHDKDELAHYAKTGAGTCDIEYRFPFSAPGFGELEGVADRSDFDLTQHAQHSGAKLQYLDRTKGEIAKNGMPKGEWHTPNVIEPSAGADRGVLALLCEAYTPDPERPSKVYMKFAPRIAPIKAAVFPLVKKDGMPEIANRLHQELRARFGMVQTDPKQSIGKRYARMDEAGCPYCFTIDSDTLTNQTVTVRHRDTLAQDRVGLDQVADWLGERLES